MAAERWSQLVVKKLLAPALSTAFRQVIRILAHTGTRRSCNDLRNVRVCELLELLSNTGSFDFKSIHLLSALKSEPTCVRLLDGPSRAHSISSMIAVIRECFSKSSQPFNAMRRPPRWSIG